jgi:hypothetical protein
VVPISSKNQNCSFITVHTTHTHKKSRRTKLQLLVLSRGGRSRLLLLVGVYPHVSFLPHSHALTGHAPEGLVDGSGVVEVVFGESLLDRFGGLKKMSENSKENPSSRKTAGKTGRRKPGVKKKRKKDIGRASFEAFLKLEGFARG